MADSDEIFEHAPDCRGRVQVFIGGAAVLDACSCVIALLHQVVDQRTDLSLALRSSIPDATFTIETKPDGSRKIEVRR